MPQRDHATPHTRSGEHAKQSLLSARSSASSGKGWAVITPESGGPPAVSSPGDTTMMRSVSAELAPPGNDSIDGVNPGIRDDDEEEEDFGQGEEYVFDEGTGEWAKRRRALSPRTRQREMIFREREEAMKRVEGALIKSEELLLTDLEDEAEVCFSQSSSSHLFSRKQQSSAVTLATLPIVRLKRCMRPCARRSRKNCGSM
jgi:hypothetical protein